MGHQSLLPQNSIFITQVFLTCLHAFQRSTIDIRKQSWIASDSGKRIKTDSDSALFTFRKPQTFYNSCHQKCKSPKLFLTATSNNLNNPQDKSEMLDCFNRHFILMDSMSNSVGFSQTAPLACPDSL